MPFFRYTAIDPSGRQLAGTVQAKDFSHAGELLGAKGLRGVSLHTGTTTSVIRTKRVGDRDLLFCLSQVAAMTKDGMTPYAAFRNVAQRTRNHALKKACEEIAARTEAGEPASSVMEKYIDIFPHNAVATVRAGEYGGFLPESFQFLADHYSDSAAFKI